MKLLKYILLILLIATPSYASGWTDCFDRGDCKIISEPAQKPVELARMSAVMAGAGGGAVVKTCAVNGTETTLGGYSGTSYKTAGGATDQYTYVGQASFDPGSNFVVCSVRFNVRNEDDGSKDWCTEIHITGANQILGSVATGTCVSPTPQTLGTAGDKIWTGFDCPMSSGTLYNIVITHCDHSYSATYIAVYYDSAGTLGTSGNLSTWYGSGSKENVNLSADMNFKLIGYYP